LNAKVDLNSDSISLLGQRQALLNAKRSLNTLLARDLETTFEVSPIVTFLSGEELQNYKESYQANNTRLLLNRSNQEINELGLKAQKSTLIPRLSANGAYGYSEGQFPATGFLASNNTVGLSAGINLNWNLFQSGSQQVGIRNARLALEAAQLQEKQIEQEVLRDLRNAEGNYRNALEVYRLQQENVTTASENYRRAQSQFELGQITSIELRQAQINLLNAALVGIQSKFSAKLAELEYLNHCGVLLDASI
jgi:outer membrane protein TolC